MITHLQFLDNPCIPLLNTVSVSSALCIIIVFHGLNFCFLHGECYSLHPEEGKEIAKTLVNKMEGDRRFKAHERQKLSW